MELKKKQGIHWETLEVGEFWELSISGDLKIKTEGRPISDSSGQMLDSIKQPSPKLRKIRHIWRRYHLNDLQAGTKHQTQVLQDWKQRPKRDRYDADVKFLEKQGLLVDKGYKYGTKWLTKPIPTSTRLEIITLFR